MANDLISELLTRLENTTPVGEAGFELLRRLAGFVNRDSDNDTSNPRVQTLLLRALERRGEFGELSDTLDSLVRLRGLYPYLDDSESSFGTSLAIELNRPANLADVVFHRVQSDVYRLLLNGANVILSAPTSFGKSLIIDAVIASHRYHNIVVVVPTIALIDETRRRLSQRFRDSFKIITHPSQQLGERNILILTQERVIDFPDLSNTDFFVIDEFYKLDPRQDQDRAMLLNQAFYRLYSTKAQFYMLGPNIRHIPLTLPEHFKFTFLATDYTTVVSEIRRVHSTPAMRQDTLITLARSLNDPTLIFCASPASARRVAAALDAAEVGAISNQTEDAAAWAADHYHPDWAFVRALRRGIGLHHGRVPRALQQYAVRAFNEGSLRYLVCTSTLIEGVNTKAKNIIVYDNKISTKKYDYFTFNNIRGRSGRMFQHFIGHVYLFNDPPPEEFPIVDLPLFTQGEKTPESLLIQLEDHDLTSSSRARLAHLKREEVLPLSLLKVNGGIDPSAQVRLAVELQEKAGYYGPLLRWTSMPSYPELSTACELIWEFLVPGGTRRSGVASGKQLAFKIHRFRLNHSARRLILQELAEQDANPDADLAVEDVLDFLRYWPSFQFPRFLMVLSRIQGFVFQRLGLPSGNYAGFAAAVESSFLPPGLAALDEYGVPLELSRRLADNLGRPETLDQALRALKELRTETLALAPFERTLLAHAREPL